MTAGSPPNPPSNPPPKASPASPAYTVNPLRESRLNTSQDFTPGWDVPGLNRDASDLLLREIRRVRDGKRKEPDPAQMLYVLLAQPGYGKTHLFGRLGHLLGDEVFFVFVPAVEDPSRPLEHIRWHLVESLFRPRPPRQAAIVATLARLCRPSFRRYLSEIPPALKDRHRELIRAFEAPGGGGHGMLEMVRSVNRIEPFLSLAQSVAAKSPHLPGPVVRALALGWSPAADSARRWLRGETLPQEQLDRLQLPDDPPSPADVLRAVPTLLRHRAPVVICCDQVESVLDKTDGPRTLTTRLMEILQGVPNLFPILSCLESEWPEFYNRSFVAAKQRFRTPPLVLQSLDGPQAVELVSRRIAGWVGAEVQPGEAPRPPVWPFDEASLVRYAEERFPSPRAVIQRCAGKLDQWLEAGGSGLIDVTAEGKPAPPPAEVFLREWKKELAEVAKSPARSPANSPEPRLHRAVLEALRLARDFATIGDGWRIADVSEGAIRQVGAEKMYSLSVRLEPVPETGHPGESEPAAGFNVAVPVTKVDNGYRFRFYLQAIEEALAGDYAGCLMVHEKQDFRRGNATAVAFDAARAEGRLRLFALEQHPQTYHRLECFLGFLDKAAGGELLIDGRAVSPDECRELAKRTKALEGLDLFQLLAGWGRLESADDAEQAVRNVAG